MPSDILPCMSTPTLIPPAFVEESSWDILLALYSDEGRKLSLDKLAALTSLPRPILNRWLVRTEREQLISGICDQGKIRAVLSPRGRTLLDYYLSATDSLQMGTRSLRGYPDHPWSGEVAH